MRRAVFTIPLTALEVTKEGEIKLGDGRKLKKLIAERLCSQHKAYTQEFKAMVKIEIIEVEEGEIIDG